MSIESTKFISRNEALQMAIAAMTDKMTKLHSMTDTELEDFLYSITRDIDYYSNYSIREPNYVTE